MDSNFHSVYDPDYKLNINFTNHFIQIDVRFFFSYLESLNMGCKIDKEIWITNMNQLVLNGILSKIKSTLYYFTKDIEMIVKA